MINLINLPQPNSLDDKLDPPLGLMYIAAVLRERDIDVKITDLCFVDRSKWKEAIGAVDYVGMTVFSSSLYLAKEVAAIAKENNPGCKVVVGGPHPTSLPEETSEFFDHVVIGEGEFAFLHLDSAIVKEPQIQQLDILPLPARDLVDIHRYTRRVAGQKATSITTSRGCPYKCAFCCKDVFGHKVRTFSNNRVIREISSCIDLYDIRSFIFYDDTFALDRARFYPLCEVLQRFKITFRCNGDLRNNTLEDFKVLKAAGCREIAFGVESGSQEILDKIHKGTTVEGNIKAIQNAKKAGLVTKAFLMIGNPGESVKTIEDTKRFMEKAGPDQYTLFTFVPLPGCAVWNDPAKYGVKIVNKDFKNYFNIAGQNDGGIVIETEDLSGRQIRRLKDNLLSYLTSRGQTGALQDYYGKVAT